MTSTLISVAELKQQLDINTVILDCRYSLADPSLGHKQYRVGHIPGACYFSLDRHLSNSPGEHGGRHPLPNAEQFAEQLRLAGVNPFSKIVVYDDSKFGFAARAWWLIRYFGHPDVAILNGGFSAWKRAHLPIDRRRATAKLGLFKPIPHTDWILDYQQVRDVVAGKSSAVIDSREQQRFLGIEEPIDPVAGRIPSALNYPWLQVTDEKGYSISTAAHCERWREIPADKEIVVYCGSGVTACANILSLAIADRHAKLYPGSWSDWCSHKDAPIATG